MKFSQAVGLAFLMVVLAVISGKISAGYFALVILYLVLAALLPAVFVPVGVVIVLAEILFGGTGNSVGAWLSSLGKPAVTP